MIRTVRRANQSHIVIKIAPLNAYKARILHGESPALVSTTRWCRSEGPAGALWGG
jgi:hypothetical protein